MAEINFDEIKKEYISSDVSLRSLARKYNIAISTIAKRAKKEDWETAKETIKHKSEQLVIEQTIDSRASIAGKCIRILEKLVDKVEESVDTVAPTDISAKRQLISMVKDLHDMGAFELMSTQSENTITIKFDDGVDEYG